MKRLIFVRHGQSIGNINPQAYFENIDCDILLTKTGEEQAKNAQASLRKCISNLFPADYNYDLYVSPYKRAVDTAKIITDFDHGGHSKPRHIQDARLRERAWGGLRELTMQNLHNDTHFNFFYRPENGESFADCFDRACNFDNSLQLHGHPKTNVIISHGEFIKCYMMYKLGWTLDDFCKMRNPWNAEVIELEFTGLRWDLVSHENFLKVDEKIS